MPRPSKAMTIAGSDSGGGAGIQADLKTFAALGVYGTSAVTAITAQNTLGVTAVQELPPDMVAAQIDTVMSDIGADAVKTGMLANSGIIRIVAEKVGEHAIDNLVVDPVMVAKGGDRLLQEEAVEALRGLLVPLAVVVTPNLPEASVLVGRSVESLEDARRAARDILDMGARSVVVKGGHLQGDAVDVFYDGKQLRELSAPRVDTTSTHGTGCTFASAVAAGLAQGMDMEDAVVRAKEYVTAAIRSAFPVGGGHGPLHHFHATW
ncbi:MAG: bifunctional hydroxymethylpyrimidine kinase/phosphomethylpyrimidine kinase [Chloroflexota bacterium]|nr:bifunctional hydroxymethylpyrimidine kinase/phosphomethylpyrimidine kinase [Chloroflexota bacterium]MDE2941100.1 bifunctional hydroxymethylpyrimidine kinase/phosphomethylpyrimidine kinase [Chloroflexota bacterium]MDE3267374.1 bifunctional hydroxymethylpyrimidine kinase/phosphomethylpyrimidine kinase [Chloroflexota bacterium]